MTPEEEKRAMDLLDSLLLDARVQGANIAQERIQELEESHTELLRALELAEKKLVRLHLSLSHNEKAGRRSADADPDVQEIRAAINKAKGEQP